MKVRVQSVRWDSREVLPPSRRPFLESEAVFFHHLRTGEESHGAEPQYPEARPPSTESDEML